MSEWSGSRTLKNAGETLEVDELLLKVCKSYSYRHTKSKPFVWHRVEVCLDF